MRGWWHSGESCLLFPAEVLATIRKFEVGGNLKVFGRSRETLSRRRRFLKSEFTGMMKSPICWGVQPCLYFCPAVVLKGQLDVSLSHRQVSVVLFR
jgi:hypothetical protein